MPMPMPMPMPMLMPMPMPSGIDATTSHSARMTDDIGYGKETNTQRRNNLERLFREGFKPKTLEESLNEMSIPNVDEFIRKHVKGGADSGMEFLAAYTADWEDDAMYEYNPYWILNKALADGKDEDRKRVLGFLYGVLRDLRKLPVQRYSVLYRAVREKLEWNVGETRELAGFTSTTMEEECTTEFLSKDGRGMLMRIHGACGADIRNFSRFGEKEKEVLIEPLTSVVVRSVEEKDKVRIVDVGVDEGYLLSEWIQRPDRVDVLGGYVERMMEDMESRMCERVRKLEGKHNIEVAGLKKEMKDMERRMCEQAQMLERKHDVEIAGLKEEMKAKLAEKSTEIVALRGEMKDAQDKHSALEEEMKTKEAEIVALRGDMKDAQDKHTAEIAVLKKEMEEAQDKVREYVWKEMEARLGVPGHDLVMRGNGTTGDAAMGLYRQAGDMGYAMGWFNAGNCLMFGVGGGWLFGRGKVERDKEAGLEMWMKGMESVKKNGGRGLERWAEESNEKAACGKELDLSGLLIGCGGCGGWVVDGSIRRDEYWRP